MIALLNDSRLVGFAANSGLFVDLGVHPAVCSGLRHGWARPLRSELLFFLLSYTLGEAQV